MIPHGLEIYVGLDPIDLRWGFERLSGIVTERVRSGARRSWGGPKRAPEKTDRAR